MSTDDCIIGLYIRVDELLRDEPQHPQAALYPSEIVTLALLVAWGEHPRLATSSV